MYIAGRAANPNDPTAHNAEAGSPDHVANLTKEEAARAERAEYELWKSHMAARRQRIEYDRMSATGTVMAHLRRVKDASRYDPVIRELFDQIAALKAEVAALRGEKVSSAYDPATFPFIIASQVETILSKQTGDAAVPHQWRDYTPPPHLVAEDLANEDAE